VKRAVKRADFSRRVANVIEADPAAGGGRLGLASTLTMF
jgi:hypothetical protein